MKKVLSLISVSAIALMLSSCPEPQTQVYNSETVILPYPSKTTTTKITPARPGLINPATLEAVGPSDR